MLPNKCPNCEYQGKIMRMETDQNIGDMPDFKTIHQLHNIPMESFGNPFNSWSLVICPRCLIVFLVLFDMKKENHFFHDLILG